MKCEVCLQNWKWEELRAVQIWHTITPEKKRQTVNLYYGDSKETHWLIDHLEKEIIVCFDCLKELNFKEIA